MYQYVIDKDAESGEEAKRGHLMFNGLTCICPFTPVQLIPSQAVQGGFNERQRNCGAWCPLFERDEENESVNIHCGKGRTIKAKKLIRDIRTDNPKPKIKKIEA